MLDIAGLPFLWVLEFGGCYLNLALIIDYVFGLTKVMLRQ